MSTRKSSSFWCHLLLLVVMVAGLSGPAAAQHCWSATGATATVALSDLSSASQGSGTGLAVLPTAPGPFVLDARYSISGIQEDTGSVPNGKRLVVRYFDHGPESRVRVILREVFIPTDTAGTEIVVFDSDQYPSSPNTQIRGLQLSPCGFGQGFLPGYHYFLKVELTKSGAGNPVLYLVEVCEGAGVYC